MNKITYVLIGLLALIGGISVYQYVNPRYIETTKTVTTLDSTAVDSLQSVIEYLESIPPETTTVKVEIPVPVETDSTYIYTIPYSDSLMTAQWRVESYGELVDFHYEYYYRYQAVREVRNTFNETRYLTKVQTITRTKQPNAYLSLGIMLNSAPELTISPAVTYTLSGGQTFGGAYNLQDGSFSLIYTHPLRFRLPF